MGTVYSATAPDGTIVAIKVLDDVLATVAQQVRFSREVEARPGGLWIPISSRCWMRGSTL